MTVVPLRHGIVGTLLAAMLGVSPNGLEGQPDFGDDASRWANDGECDDPRFAGEGAAVTLLEDDRGHDASDCRALFTAGRVTLRGAALDDVEFGDDAGEWARDGECDDPRFEGEGMATTLVEADAYHDATDCRALHRRGRIALRDRAHSADLERGRLEKGDDTLPTGEYADAYTFSGAAGERAVVDLRSTEFDPYLLVRAPGGEQFDNDDFEGDGTRSLLALELVESGEYRVTVTSYRKGETGDYTLSMTVGLEAGLAAPIEHAGALEASDSALSSGEYFDNYEFAGTPGQHVAIDLRSSAFDTYLILRDPAGEQIENDDATDGDGVGHSKLELVLPEAGTYRVLVTSYESGESGPYSLTIHPAAADRDAPADRDVASLMVGRPIGGELGGSDATFESGEHHDTYVFDGTAGETVRLELSSTDFDTYLGLVTPSGDEIANDDFEGATDRSVIELSLPESGRYRVQATSYSAAETGRYRLALMTGAAQAVKRRSQGRVYGLFAGISDYEPPNTDLEYTADDAARIRDALIGGGGMRAEDAYTLVDSEATVGNVTAAIRDIAGRMGPDDTFVMFYSGHGSQLPRSDGPTASDPDAMDETLTLYDGSLRDDDLRSLFDEIDEGTVLLWLDSCFSGGFAKDVVSAPGRMGIFSSEEDITSNVANKFRAGGYLSHFLDDAIAQGLADDDGDGSITAIELSQYLHERYRADVKNATPSVLVRTDMTLGYQHLVVDRGSIGAYDVLFER